MLLSIFLGPHIRKKKGKTENIKKSKEILEENKKNISKKSIPEHLRNHQRLVEEDQVCKIKKFDSIFSTDKSSIGKKNSI